MVFVYAICFIFYILAVIFDIYLYYQDKMSKDKFIFSLIFILIFGIMIIIFMLMGIGVIKL